MHLCGVLYDPSGAVRHLPFQGRLRANDVRPYGGWFRFGMDITVFV